MKVWLQYQSNFSQSKSEARLFHNNFMQKFLSSYNYHQRAIKFFISRNKNDFVEFIIAVSSDKYAVIFCS